MKALVKTDFHLYLNITYYYKVIQTILLVDRLKANSHLYVEYYVT